VTLDNDVARQHAVVADRETERLELGLHYHRPSPPPQSVSQRTSSRANGRSKDLMTGDAEEQVETAEGGGQLPIPLPPPSERVPVKVTTRLSNSNTKVELSDTAADGLGSGNGVGLAGSGASYVIDARLGLNVLEIVAGPLEAEEVYRVFISV
jgi:hypothetical protein